MKDELYGIDKENLTEVDALLEQPGQHLVRNAVRALPEDTPSLAWRSGLNVALQETAARQRKRQLWGWLWKPSAGLALASCMALLFVAQMPKAPAPDVKPDIESALVDSYLQSKNSWEVTGDGVTVTEAQDVSGSKEPDWFREDIGATL